MKIRDIHISTGAVAIGALLMLLGVYFSYLLTSALGFIVIGIPVFLYGIHLDLRPAQRPDRRRRR